MHVSGLWCSLQGSTPIKYILKHMQSTYVLPIFCIVPYWIVHCRIILCFLAQLVCADMPVHLEYTAFMHTENIIEHMIQDAQDTLLKQHKYVFVF